MENIVSIILGGESYKFEVENVGGEDKITNVFLYCPTNDSDEPRTIHPAISKDESDGSYEIFCTDCGMWLDDFPVTDDDHKMEFVGE